MASMAFVYVSTSTSRYHQELSVGNAPPMRKPEGSNVQVKLSLRSGQRSRSVLSWTNSNVFGFKATSLPVPRAATTLRPGQASQTSVQVTAFTQEQAKLVKDSWKFLLKNDPGKHAMNFFLKVFEIAPTVKRMFHFLDDTTVPMEKNPKLKVHALQVLVMTGESAAQMGEKGALDALHPKLLELGRSHAIYGVQDEHFDVVKYALLSTFEGVFGEQWNSELKNAWAQAYDEIVAAIKEEMKAALKDSPVPSS